MPDQEISAVERAFEGFLSASKILERNLREYNQAQSAYHVAIEVMNSSSELERYAWTKYLIASQAAGESEVQAKERYIARVAQERGE